MKFLARYYPIFPNGELQVYQLDCLDEKYQPPISQNWFDVVKHAYDMFEFAKDRHGEETPGLTYYNNSLWYMDEADNIFEFIEKFESVCYKKE